MKKYEGIIKKYQGRAVYYYDIEAESYEEALAKLEEIHGTEPDEDSEFFLTEEE